MHLWQSLMPRASESSVPLALQLLTVQIFISPSMSHLGLRGSDLSDGNCKVSHFSRAGLPWRELISVFCCHYQRPLVLAGQSFLMPCWELCTCDGSVHCWIAYWSTCDGRAHCLVSLSAALLKLYVCCYYFIEINQFLYDFAVGHWAADLLLLLMIASLPQAIGPTLGASFRLSRVLDYPHRSGSASHVLGLWQRTETKAMDVDE